MKWGRRFRRRLRNALLGFHSPDGVVFLPRRYEPRWNDQRVWSEWDRTVNFQSNQEVLCITVPVCCEDIQPGDYSKAASVVREVTQAARDAVTRRFSLA